MISVTWIKFKSGDWVNLETVDLSTIRESACGCYIIWHTGNPSRVVRVGQGNIRERLACHRQDRDVLQHRGSGSLFVTWAELPASQMDGVERHLAERWKPLVGDRWPNAVPIEVNSPFAA